ncbi:regulatory protein GemA [Campylobacter sp. 2352 PW]|uniref:phage protein GemA/Gp16 family protein n=1 Tax=Campylobacter sp. 2352 PW TaxID=2735750 RepID=UPI00301D01D7|nr:regulatory protein GemA [Campylobacter sp. 2352 PW]
MQNLKKQLIKIIHTLRKDAHLSDDESYRWILNERYGKSSSKDLSIEELRDFAIALGYDEKFLKNTKKTRYFKNENTKSGRATKKQLNMIQAIWSKNAKNPTQWALREFINNIIKKRPLHLWYLSIEDANKVILGLKNLENNSTHSAERS